MIASLPQACSSATAELLPSGEVMLIVIGRDAKCCVHVLWNNCYFCCRFVFFLTQTQNMTNTQHKMIYYYLFGRNLRFLLSYLIRTTFASFD